ncbi:MAG: sensor histidine kinase [Sphingobacteriaceae bacterium]
MNIYTRKQQWKWLLAIAAFAIVIVSLWYTNNLVKRIAEDERRKVRLWAEAVQKKANLVKFTNQLFEKMKIEERKKAILYAKTTEQLTKDFSNFNFLLYVLQDNTTVPVILADEQGKILAKRNFDSIKEKDDAYMQSELEGMQKMYPPVEIQVDKKTKQYLFYKDSRVFNDIKLVFDSLIKSFITEVAVNSADVPVIYTDSTTKQVMAYGKIDTTEINSSEKLAAKLNQLRSENPPIAIDLGEGTVNYIFYAQSNLLTQLKYYPYVQFGVIGLFLLIAYILFSTARKAEQDQVWVGMSKETAHQLGTPLSSLMAWNEHLKSIGVDESIVTEMQNDVERLSTITDRFSKIGSQPTLVSEDVVALLDKSLQYLKKRTSKNINNQVKLPDHPINIQLSAPLFEWVIENLCKNAVDAMDGKGDLNVELVELPEQIQIIISDTGKGIAKNKFKEVFKPGYTTKQRGWGLGLSLCKRIIENYHDGKIYVKESEIGKGTTFCIELRS